MGICFLPAGVPCFVAEAVPLALASLGLPLGAVVGGVADLALPAILPAGVPLLPAAPWADFFTGVALPLMGFSLLPVCFASLLAAVAAVGCAGTCAVAMPSALVTL